MVRWIIVGVPLAVIAALIAAYVTVSSLHPVQKTITTQATISTPVPAPREYIHTVKDIPVLAWHQVIAGTADNTAEDIIWNFNKDCKPTALVCNSKSNVETVSVTQLTNELAYLKRSGYQSITAAQYDNWVAGKKIPLPAKPILLTVDDGTLNSYVDVTPVLQKYGFNMVTFIVSQFADGAAADEQPYAGWNATWAQLKALPTAQWSFAFHAGARGHNVTFPNNPGCTYFYPCQLPDETDAAYQQRVSSEITIGRAVEESQLGSRFNTQMWAVPWNDLAVEKDLPTSGPDPKVWLAKWAATQFPVIFVQDPLTNGFEHERYRLEVQGTWSETTFEFNLNDNIHDGFFNRP
jgi:hypothetical protein